MLESKLLQNIALEHPKPFNRTTPCKHTISSSGLSQLQLFKHSVLLACVQVCSKIDFILQKNAYK